MKQKIVKLNKDLFDTRLSNIEFSTTSIFFAVNANETYNGGFTISSKDYKPVRGMIYTSTFRMQCRVNGFDSEKTYIPFTFNANGLAPGEKITGKFIVLTEAGEYEIRFCASINVTTIESKFGSFTNLDEFRDLAYTDYESAFKCFISNKFRDILPEEKEDILNLYDGLNRFEINEHAMEEFLIGLNLKSSVQIEVLEKEKTYKDLEFSITDSVDILKNDWGYLPIEVRFNADFIDSDITKFSTLDFTDNAFRYEYTILEDKLHEGKNFATISFITPYDVQKIDIVVGKKKTIIASEDNHYTRLTKKLSVELVKNYILYKCGSMDGIMWKNIAIPKLEQLYELSDNKAMYKMIQAQVYKEADMDIEARSVLEKFGRDFWNSDKDNILWGYYLFIASSLKNDISYTIKASDEIKKLYNRNDSSWELLWAILQMESYLISNPDQRLKVIENQYNEGHFHSILLLEAFLVIKDQPSLLEHLNPFILHVLVFAKRRGILTEDIARYVAIIAGRIREYNPRIFEVLEGCYKVLPSKDILAAICKYLISGRKVEEKYFKWYELGINEGLHITNLYEFYMYSVNENSEVVLPHNVYLYFARPNNLDYRKKSFIYANIVKKKEDFPEIFDRIEDEISKFTIEQLRLGRINKNLKLLYDNYLGTFKLGREENKALADLYYTYEISVDATNLAQAIILHKGLVSPSVVSIIDGKALVRLYTKDDQILLQDKSGKVFVKTIPFKVSKCMGDEHFREYIRQNCPRHIGVLLSTIYSHIITPENISCYRDIIDVDGVQEATKKDVKKALLWYFYETDNHMGVSQYISHVVVNQLNQEERSMYFGILLGENRLKGAFETIREYGYEGIDSELLLDFVDQYLSLTGFEENIILSELSMYLFRLGIVSENILKYLEEIYCGTTDSMIEIWEAVKNTGKKTSHIEERILIQMLFCEEVTDESEIFHSYYTNTTNLNLVLKKAYLSYKAFSYFVFNNELESRFFDYIYNEYSKGVAINTSCKLACLKYYSNYRDNNNETNNMLDEFIEDLANKNLVFGFFRNFSDEILTKLSLSNRYIVSYQGSESSKIIIHYAIAKEGETDFEFKEEIMPPLYYTYYLKEFVLFKGEVLHYYLVEEKGDKSRVVEVQNVTQEDIASSGTGRFYAINNILSEEYPQIKLEEYEKKSYLVNQLFQIQ